MTGPGLGLRRWMFVFCVALPAVAYPVYALPLFAAWFIAADAW